MFPIVRSALFVAAASAAGLATAAAPDTIVWEGGHLLRVRESGAAAGPGVGQALAALRREADSALERGPYSVMDKDLTPPSGDKHDYMSFSRYWWPNPDTPNGLPYVRRDGVVNRELIARGDRNRIGALYDDLEALALAAYLLDAERYGPHAAELVRVWFLDPDTRMYPNLNFGQAVPGRSEGRGPGIIDTRHFVRVIDSVALLRACDQIADGETDQLKDWFRDYLGWLDTSAIGEHERNADNNHGVWYDAQASAIALFVGRPQVAESIVRRVRDERLAAGVAADGRQPEELERTKSLHYSLFALSAYAVAARVGEHVGVDLWGHTAPGGGSLRGALDYAAPHLVDQSAWPHPRLGPFAVSDRQSQLFYLAATRLQEPRYLELLARAPTRYDGRHLAPLMFAAQASEASVEED
ncbi:alginate lyase family protein [Botrimarina sp.]|uniref:alginate lyase family protein n=1 Tax=Botrimarina sp. TaxID=2795802 RepID=UPI0032ED0798